MMRRPLRSETSETGRLRAMPATVATAASELIAWRSRSKWSCTSGRMMLKPPRSKASRNVWEKRTTIGTGFAPAVIDRGSRIARRNEPGKARAPRARSVTPSRRLAEILPMSPRPSCLETGRQSRSRAVAACDAAREVGRHERGQHQEQEEGAGDDRERRQRDHGVARDPELGRRDRPRHPAPGHPEGHAHHQCHDAEGQGLPGDGSPGLGAHEPHRPGAPPAPSGAAGPR